MGTLWDILNSNVGVNILTDIGTAVLTIILYTFVNKCRIKRKQKEEFDKILGGKIASALDSVRDLELSMKTKEAYDIENRLDSSENMDFFAYSGDVYPSIMASNESFFKFIDKVGDAINNCEKYLNYNVAAYLSYTQNYCMNAVAYAIQHKIPLDALGTKIFPDFQELQKKFDIELVNLMNRPQYKVYSINGTQWEDAKKEVIEPLLQNSVLCKMMIENGDVEIQW